MQAPAAEREPVPAADALRVAAVFEANGAVHVRDAIPAGVVERVREASRRMLRRWDDAAAAGALEGHDRVAHERRYIALPLLDAGGDAAAMLLTPAIAALGRAYLGKEPIVHESSHVREMVVGRVDTHLPYHQDETIVERRVLNVWIPLVECGRDAPGLELVANSWRTLFPPEPLPAAKFPVERARLRPETIVRTFGPDAFWRPAFRPGDAMLFSGATVHRTFSNPLMTSNRLSVEMRLA